MLGVVIVVAAVGAILASSYGTQQARKRAVEGAFRTLDAEPTRVQDSPLLFGHWAIEGRLRGVTVRYALRAGGRNSPSRTTCEAIFSATTELEMYLRPETAREIRHVEHGRAVDLVLGDEAFDESFIVEAAPSDMARILLDRNSRTGLLAFHPCTMTLGGDELRFVKNAYLDEPAEIVRVLELCADVASRVATIPGQLLEHRLAEGHGTEATGYRGPSSEAIHALDRSPHDATELANLHAARTKRRRLVTYQTVAVVLVAVVAGILAATARR